MRFSQAFRRVGMMGTFFFLPALAFPDGLFPTPTPADSYSWGFALFQQKQYGPAIPPLEEAVKEKPGDPRAYYYLAYCQYLTGDLRDADYNFYRMCQKEGAPSIKAFAGKIKDRLSPEDQEWVEQQLRATAPAGPGNPATSGPASQAGTSQGVTSIEADFHPFSVRLTCGADFANLGDFYTEKDSLATVAQAYQTSDPSLTYDQSIPWALAYLQLNPFVTFGDFEIGGRYTYFFPTGATYYRADSYGYSVNFSADFSTFSVEGVSRFYIPLDTKTKFFIEPSLGYQPLHMVFTITNVKTTGTPPNNTYGFTADGSTLDLGLNLGVRFKDAGGFSFSLSGGYEYAQIQNLTATFFDAAHPDRNGLPGTAVMSYDSYWKKYFIWFLPNDPGYDYLFYGGSSSAQNTRPMIVDFSGVRLALDLSYSF